MAARRKTAAPGGQGGLRVTWVRSEIGHKAAARGTIRALGLHRLQQTVVIADTPVNRGMIRRVAFLLAVEEPGAGGSRTGPEAPQPAVEPAKTTEEGREAS